jgi:hypothetical protein
MKKTVILPFAVVLCLSVSSMAQSLNLKNIKSAASKATSAAKSGTSGTKSGSLTQDEAASGLKSALTEGSKKASTNLHKTDGYFKDNAVKILLPAEAQPIAKNIKMIPGGQKMEDDAILRMNRAAEDAAVTAADIFINAITRMTIVDAINILYGQNDAATVYLKKNTYNELKLAFQPKIATSLNKKIVGNISAAESWSVLMTANNNVARTIPGQMAGMKKVNTNLSEYVTEKALDGLFVKIAEVELDIRKNTTARVNDILKKVFGQLDLRK